MKRRIATVALLLLGCASILVARQAAAPPATQISNTGAISGITVDEATGRPLQGVTVSLYAGAIRRNTTSDASGRFAFRSLPNGESHLRVSLDGWVTAELANDHADEDAFRFSEALRSIPLGQDQRIDNVRLGLRRLAILSGRVTDESGAPVVRANVSAMYDGVRAGRRLVTSGPFVSTDQQGVFRLSGLIGGDYVLTASVPFPRMREINAVPGAGLFVFQRSFYPGVATTSSPRMVSVGWGETRSRIDFTLKRAPAMRVTGQVTGADSFANRPYVHLELTEPLAREDRLFVATSSLDAEGRFNMAPVPPGRYVLTTFGAQSKAARLLWTRQAVLVGSADVVNLQVPVQEGLRINGRVQFDGARARPAPADLERISIALLPPDRLRIGDVLPPHGKVRNDGTFTSAETAAGRYILHVWGLPEGWVLRSAIIGGKDAADVPLELATKDIDRAVLTFTDRLAHVRGRVVNRTGQAAAKAYVLIFPASELLWTDFGHARRLRWATAGNDGTYKLDSIPAGDYLMAAVPGVPQRGWRDAAFLKVLAATAVHVSISEGNDLSQPLRLTTAGGK